MAESAHYHQLGKFVVLFQKLESSLIEIIDVIADEDCAVEILPAETEYTVSSIDAAVPGHRRASRQAHSLYLCPSRTASRCSRAVSGERRAQGKGRLAQGIHRGEFTARILRALLRTTRDGAYADRIVQAPGHRMEVS